MRRQLVIPQSFDLLELGGYTQHVSSHTVIARHRYVLLKTRFSVFENSVIISFAVDQFRTVLLREYVSPHFF